MLPPTGTCATEKRRRPHPFLLKCERSSVSSWPVTNGEGPPSSPSNATTALRSFLLFHGARTVGSFTEGRRMDASLGSLSGSAWFTRSHARCFLRLASRSIPRIVNSSFARNAPIPLPPRKVATCSLTAPSAHVITPLNRPYFGASAEPAGHRVSGTLMRHCELNRTWRSRPIASQRSFCHYTDSVSDRKFHETQKAVKGGASS
mmetsp:Transcript_2437/g.6090  ORF Transcript_2437/g.6090 Transcript_2437/m.6090 type:complete len:204 (+) Transcript_2437:2-613(+)